jgi:hypothetical protein
VDGPTSARRTDPTGCPRRSPRARAVGLVAGLLIGLPLLASSTDAAAYCRATTTSKTSIGIDGECVTTGVPLAWASSCVSFDVQRDGSRQVDVETARRVVQRAFDAWSQADCPVDRAVCGEPAVVGEAGHPSLRAVDLGPAACACAEFSEHGANANLIIFRDQGWVDCHGAPMPEADIAYAITTVTYSVKTGEIYDADLEINAKPDENELSTIDPPGVIANDLQSILTHEFGHALGLAHTQTTHLDATMFAGYQTGSVAMRTLDVDDVCGVCAIYPPSRAATCDPTPRRGFSPVCEADRVMSVVAVPGAAGEDVEGSGCALTGRGHGVRGCGGVAGCALALAAAIARWGRARR